MHQPFAVIYSKSNIYNTIEMKLVGTKIPLAILVHDKILDSDVRQSTLLAGKIR